MAGVFLHNGLVSFSALFGRRRDRLYFWFGLLCFLGAGYAVACLLKYHSADAESYKTASRWMSVIGRGIMMLVPWFIAYYSDYRPKRFLFVISALFLARGLLDVLLPDALLYPGVPELRFLETPWNEKLAAWSVNSNAFTPSLYALYLAMVLYVGLALRHLSRNRYRARLAGLGAVAAFSFLAFVNDALLDAGVIRSINLEEFALFSFIVLMGFFLGARRIQAESNYRMLFNAVNDAIYVHDARTGMVLDLNDAAARMHGTTREILLRDYMKAMFPDGPHGVPSALEMIARAEREGPLVFEWQVRRLSDGEPLWVEVALRAETLDGRPVVLATVRDVTGRKRAEDRLRDAQKMESLGMLAGGVAHDFNNLLTTILGNSELACQDLPAGSSARSNLENIQAASHRAAELCSQLQAYSGKGRFSVGPVDLKILVEEMIRILQVSIPQGVPLDLSFSPSLLPVTADATQVRQVVMNLILNAAEALEGRKGSIRIEAGSEHLTPEVLEKMWSAPDVAPGSFSYLEVKDDGCGMDPETRARVFEPFFSTKFTGRGLGMAAVLGILKGHRGAIHIESGRGRGTTVRVYFPVGPRPDPASAAPVTTIDAPPSPSRRLILAVDDDPAVLESSCKALEAVGFEPLPASSGHQAVELLKERGKAIAAVLLDMSMPGWDGIKTLAELKAVDPDVKTVLVSGFGLDTPLKGAGFSGFLQKPYLFDELKSVLERVLTS